MLRACPSLRMWRRSVSDSMFGVHPTFIGEVRVTPELLRIARLPRRTSPPAGYEGLTASLRSSTGTMELRPIQAQALAELHLCRGLLGPIRVGAGKTLVSFLAPLMVGSKRPLLLVPAKLRDKTKRDFAELWKHWDQPLIITVLSYELLGREQASKLMDEVHPDLIIADEAHKLANHHAAVTRRVGRYMEERPDTVFVALSGTLTKRRLRDFVHLAEWALGDQAPIPLEYKDLEAWGYALDEETKNPLRYRSGALSQLCGPEDGSFVGLNKIRHAFHRRLVETPGVVATDETAIDASIVIASWFSDWKPAKSILDGFKQLREDWETPEGMYLTSPVEVWRHARELALGFYYRWEPEPPQEWLEARRIWAAFVRNKLGHSGSLDSPAQVSRQFSDTVEYLQWERVKNDYEPTTVPIWLDDEVLCGAAAWVQAEGGIAWIEHQAVGAKLESLGVPYYGRMGVRLGEPIEEARGGIAASIAANREGRNLQHYSQNLVLSSPTTGSAWEQMIGRTHRDGQKADEVSFEVFVGCRELLRGLWQAVSDAQYQKGIVGSCQKLLEATITVPRPGQEKQHEYL